MTTLLKQFITDSFSREYLPTVQLLNERWAGLLFCRDEHRDLAPSGIWDALFQVHSEISDKKVGVILRSDLESGGVPELIDADRTRLMEYLDHEFRFVYEPYIFCADQRWLCRIDFEITLIAGEGWFIREVIERFGGIATAMEAMLSDFYAGSPIPPWPDDKFGMQRCLREMTSEARLSTGPNNSFKPKPLRGSA